MAGLVPVQSFSPSMAVFHAADDSSEFPRSRKESKKSSRKETRIPNRVLIVGRLVELAIYRAEFLRQAGFDVLTAVDLDEAVRMIQHRGFDVIILSYTLSSDTMRYLAEATRDYCPDCRIVAIAETRKMDRHIEADAVAMANEGPTALVAALNRVLQAS